MERIPGRKVAAKRCRSGLREERTARYDKSAVRPTNGRSESPTGTAQLRSEHASTETNVTPRTTAPSAPRGLRKIQHNTRRSRHRQAVTFCESILLVVHRSNARHAELTKTFSQRSQYVTVPPRCKRRSRSTARNVLGITDQASVVVVPAGEERAKGTTT